ncbi:MAG: AmmeMemoRadiSam system radical SAM enzyme [Synergistaceae bacterium]|jgi:pyruvate formate lyase activating enzyme|nr:AmmeMemoRadiSam system radical SAM enzyme [Synergistaceae bacterium]
MLEAGWWSERGEGVLCGLCWRKCSIARGEKGLCGVRGCSPDGRLVSPHLGRFVSIAVDPVEKKPLRRWRPGTRILSLGGVGCNMRCPFCQNHAISMPARPLAEREVPPEELAAAARDLGVPSVAYTYNEPTLQAEYIFAASPLLRSSGIATVMVTNGMFSDEACGEAMRHVDAMNVDVKTFDAEAYRRLGGSLDAVTRSVERLVAGGVHVELTNLIVPGVSDSEADFTRLVDWAESVSPDVPLHISRYFPSHEYSDPPTDVSLMRRLFGIASERLRYVYLGNV